jgi:hypothetical protein
MGPEMTEAIVTPSRSSASRDTYSAFEDYLEWHRAGLQPRNWKMARGQFSLHAQADLEAHALMKARKSLLQTYMGMDNASEMQWALLQVSCLPMQDPFDIMYRLYRLTTRGYTDSSHARRLRGTSGDLRTELFIDECQHAFGNPFAEAIQEQLLGRDCLGLYLTGTSLKLKEAREHAQRAGETYPHFYNTSEYVDSENKFWGILGRHAWEVVTEAYEIQARGRYIAAHPFFSCGGRPLGYSIEFPTVAADNWDSVCQALGSWDVLRSTMPENIKTVCTLFFGRVRWATLFAEQLLYLSSKNSGRLSDEDVGVARDRAAKRIKDALKRQIERVKHLRWASDLFWTAMDADVFSITKIFQDENTPRLIAEGFALVDTDAEDETAKWKPGVVKGCLSEPLAVEAVMEYLRESGEYDKLMNQFLNSLDIDFPQGGSMGKLAEYIFTVVSTSPPFFIIKHGTNLVTYRSLTTSCVYRAIRMSEGTALAGATARTFCRSSRRPRTGTATRPSGGLLTENTLTSTSMSCTTQAPSAAGRSIPSPRPFATWQLGSKP